MMSRANLDRSQKAALTAFWVIAICTTWILLLKLWFAPAPEEPPTQRQSIERCQ